MVVDETGRASPAVSADLDDDARWGLLEHLDAVYGLDVHLVLPENLARSDHIGRLALDRGMVVWAAPQPLVDAIRAAANLATGPPARTAAMIGRLATCTAWRGHLRCQTPSSDRRQLSLL